MAAGPDATEETAEQTSRLTTTGDKPIYAGQVGALAGQRVARTRHVHGRAGQYLPPVAASRIGAASGRQRVKYVTSGSTAAATRRDQSSCQPNQTPSAYVPPCTSGGPRGIGLLTPKTTGAADAGSRPRRTTGAGRPHAQRPAEYCQAEAAGTSARPCRGDQAKPQKVEQRRRRREAAEPSRLVNLWLTSPQAEETGSTAATR
jgi:hypothetical protein